MTLFTQYTTIPALDYFGQPYHKLVEVKRDRTRAELWAIFREREWSQGGSELPVQAVERREEVRLLKGEY